MRKNFFILSLWGIAVFFVVIVVLQIKRNSGSTIEIPQVSFQKDDMWPNKKRYTLPFNRKVDFPDTPVCWMPGAKAILPKDSVRVDTLVSKIPASIRSTFPKNTYLKIDVPYGTRYKVVLYDSSTVLLDGGTSFYVPLNFDTFRVVKLEGLGYFNVKEDSAKSPLSVQTNDVTVAVSTGRFEIFANGVNSCNIANLDAEITVINEKNGKAVLDPFLRFQHVENGGWKTSNLDPTFVPEWCLDEIDFYNKPVGIILAFAAMRYDVEVIIEGENVMTLPLTLHFNWSTTLEEFLDLIGKAGGLSCSIKGESVMVSSKDTRM